MRELSGVLSPEKFSVSPEILLCYAFDASGSQALPSAVVWPQSTDDVIALSRFARDRRIPLCPRGAGTGMTGGATPLGQAIVVSFEKMNRILAIDQENLTALVEPGVINGDLQRELKLLGLFYPPDPASMNFCTIGGNVAENAGGPRAVKYGVTRDYVLSLEAVLPDGRLLETGVRTAKGVVGYDLTRLIVGSEGTLCTLTKILLRLLPLPQQVATLLAFFDDLGSCGTVVSRIISSGIVPRTLELMDREAIQAVQRYKPVGFPEGIEAALLIELDGHPKAVADDAERVAAVCAELGAAVQVADSDDERERLWDARRSISPALYHLSPTKISEDIVVPRSKMRDMLLRLRTLSEQSGINIVCFGHAGDGNIHVNFMVDRRNGQQMEKARSLIRETFEITLSLGGTISGEHGVGITKMDYIELEVKEPAMGLMRGIKGIFDPDNVLNPGKIFP